jgi:hypothetical protein
MMERWTAYFKNDKSVIFRATKTDVENFMDGIGNPQFVSTANGKPVYLNRESVLYIQGR